MASVGRQARARRGTRMIRQSDDVRHSNPPGRPPEQWNSLQRLGGRTNISGCIVHTHIREGSAFLFRRAPQPCAVVCDGGRASYPDFWRVRRSHIGAEVRAGVSCMATYRLESRARGKSPDRKVGTPTKSSVDSNSALSQGFCGPSRQQLFSPRLLEKTSAPPNDGFQGSSSLPTSSSKPSCTRRSSGPL